MEGSIGKVLSDSNVPSANVDQPKNQRQMKICFALFLGVSVVIAAVAVPTGILLYLQTKGENLTRDITTEPNGSSEHLLSKAQNKLYEEDSFHFYTTAIYVPFQMTTLKTEPTTTAKDGCISSIPPSYKRKSKILKELKLGRSYTKLRSRISQEIAALPGGEIAVTLSLYAKREHQVLIVNNKGSLKKKIYRSNVLISGLLLVKSSLYVLHKNGSIAEIDFISGKRIKIFSLKSHYHIKHTSQISADTKCMSEILFLSDIGKREIFSYNLKSMKTSIKMKAKSSTQSVSFLKNNAAIFFIVCHTGNHKIGIYNKNWNLVREFGGKGSKDGQLLSPYSALPTPEGTILVADTNNNRISEFTLNGNLQGYLLKVKAPKHLSFYYPHLWVGTYDAIQKFKIY